MNDTSTIKSEFEKMKLIRLDIKKTFNEIETKINTLKTIYIELLNTHQDNTYIFGIDSFHFQNKMIESEYIYIFVKTLLILRIECIVSIISYIK